MTAPEPRVREVVSRGGTLALEGFVEPGTHVYVDADWVGGREGHAPALAAGGDDSAARAFASLAREVGMVLRDRGVERVEVTGRGVTAELVRRLAAVRSNEGVGDPDAVVVTAVSGASVAAALRRVADLGLVLLAAPAPAELTLSLYADLHVRGLELACRSPLVDGALADTSVPVEEVLASLSHVGQGAPLDRGARWYRVA